MICALAEQKHGLGFVSAELLKDLGAFTGTANTRGQEAAEIHYKSCWLMEQKSLPYAKVRI